MNDRNINGLIDGHKEGHALEQAFYRDPEVYERDIDAVYLNSWLYAGHESEVPKVGDYFLFNFANESVIIVRSSETEILALLNVCRHRGSRVCVEAKGQAARLTCLYHGWTYGLNGDLKAAAHMPEGFDKSALGLKKAHLRNLHGMLFVNFAENPSDFDVIESEMDECLAPYGLKNAKVAHREAYPIASNWKLAVENYCECYHCAPAHPEYSRGHSIAVPADYEANIDAVMARASACGLSEKNVQKYFLHSGTADAGYAYERYPLIRGHVTGSKDGSPVAPLLGDLKDYDGGATDFQVGPITFALAYCDHVVIYRFTPLSVDQTECDITWLVNADAEEGKDYDLEAADLAVGHYDDCGSAHHRA